MLPELGHAEILAHRKHYRFDDPWHVQVALTDQVPRPDTVLAGFDGHDVRVLQGAPTAAASSTRR